MFVAVLCASACGKCGSAASSKQGDEESAEEPDANAPMDPREAAQWAAAAQGDAEERMRLEDLVGCEGLRERAGRPDLRATAIAAMQYCPDFSELPWLAGVASDGTDADARAALETIHELAARPRRATDPEDAAELHAGCASLLTLARTPSQKKERRVGAVDALRMLADRGCVKRAEIPTDVDLK